MRGATTRSLSPSHVLRKPLVAVAVAVGLLLSVSAHAGLFDDEEARKQIVQLRAQLSDTQRALDARIGELEAQARNRSIIDLFNQVETLKT